jgi:hypothetical protein
LLSRGWLGCRNEVRLRLRKDGRGARTLI